MATKAYSVIGKNGRTYYLHGQIVNSFYFAKKVNKAKVLTDKPKGFRVKKNTKSGLPFLVRV